MRCDNCDYEITAEFIHWKHGYREDVVEEWYCCMGCFLKARKLTQG